MGTIGPNESYAYSRPSFPVRVNAMVAAFQVQAQSLGPISESVSPRVHKCKQHGYLCIYIVCLQNEACLIITIVT